MDRANPDLKLDKKETSGFLTFFRRCKEDGVVRIFDRKDYYSVHGKNAERIAREYFSTTSVIKKLGDDGLPSLTFSTNKYGFIVKDLLMNKNALVEVYSSPEKGSWQLEKKGSPGNLQQFEEQLFSAEGMKEASTVLALKLSSGDRTVVGAAFADSVGTKILTSEFADDERFSNLESLLVQNGVKEVVFSEKSHANIDKLMDVMDRTGVVVTERRKADFGGDSVEQDLKRILGSTFGNLPLLEQNLALGATACLIKYLDVLADESNYGHFKVEEYNLQQFMRLDASVIRALNLLPQPNEQSKYANLYGLLDRTRTPMGSRLLHLWLKQPLLDRVAIGERHNIVEVFVEETELRCSVYDKLRKTPDLRRYIKKFRRGQARLQDLVALYDLLRRLPGLVDSLDEYEGGHEELLSTLYTSKIKQHLESTAQFNMMVETTMDFDALRENKYLVDAKFDTQLDDLRQTMDGIAADVQAHYREIQGKLRMAEKQLHLEDEHHLASNSFCFRVTQKEEKKIRGKSEYEIIQTKKSGVYFLTSQLRAYGKKYKAAYENYKASQVEIEEKAVGVAASYTCVFEELEGVLAHLDVLLSFAVAAVEAPTPYTRPEMLPLGDGTVELVGSRHPCVEVVQVSRPPPLPSIALQPHGHLYSLPTVTARMMDRLRTTRASSRTMSRSAGPATRAAGRARAAGCCI